MYITVSDITIDFLTFPLLNLVPKLYFEENDKRSGIQKLAMPRIGIIRI